MSDPDSAPLPRRRYAPWWFLQWGAYMVLYAIINAATSGRSVATPLLPGEARIPLCLAAYPFYTSIYFAIILTLLLPRTRGEYLRVNVPCAFAAVTAFVIFLIAPMQYPRPATAGDSELAAMMHLIWLLDGRGNTFPSLHVCMAWLLWSQLRQVSRGWALLLLLQAVGVSVSTVLLKQHFIVDVLGGMILAFVAAKATPRLTRLVWPRRPTP